MADSLKNKVFLLIFLTLSFTFFLKVFVSEMLFFTTLIYLLSLVGFIGIIVYFIPKSNFSFYFYLKRFCFFLFLSLSFVSLQIKLKSNGTWLFLCFLFFILLIKLPRGVTVWLALLCLLIVPLLNIGSYFFTADTFAVLAFFLLALSISQIFLSQINNSFR